MVRVERATVRGTAQGIRTSRAMYKSMLFLVMYLIMYAVACNRTVSSRNREVLKGSVLFNLDASFKFPVLR